MAACVKKGLKVLSATGAGARVDPTRIRIADLKESSNDPLSRSVSLRPRLCNSAIEKWSHLLVLSLERDRKCGVLKTTLTVTGKASFEKRTWHSWRDPSGFLSGET